MSYGEEVCIQLLTKGALLVKDAKRLDPSSYYHFIVILLALRRRLYDPLYIPLYLPLF